MWLARNRNRRLMDWRERLARARAETTRVAVAWWRRVAVVAALVAAVTAGVHAWRTLRQSDHFMLRDLGVTGQDRLAPAEVAAACGLEVGRTNLLFTTEETVTLACEADPRIRTAAVVIEPPSRADVRVEEQRAVMYAATEGGLWAVNVHGEAYAPADPAALDELPLLVGSGLADESASLMDPQVLKDALSLVRTLAGDRSPWLNQPLLLEWDPVLGFTVSAAGRGLRAAFGTAPFPHKFERLVAALDVATGRRMIVDEVRVDSDARPNAVTLRLAPAGSPIAGM